MSEEIELNREGLNSSFKALYRVLGYDESGAPFNVTTTWIMLGVAFTEAIRAYLDAIPNKNMDNDSEPLPEIFGEINLDPKALEAAQHALGMGRRVGYVSGEHDRLGNIAANPDVEKAIRAYLVTCSQRL